MVIDLKEKQPIGMMPGGVQFTMSWPRVIRCLREAGELDPAESVTHLGMDFGGLTLRVEPG